MDEIEYKLNTNSSVLIVNAIDKLITTIKSKFKPVERQKFVLENEELRFLREKCSSKESLVSLTACQGLLALVELGVLEIGHTMSTVVTLLPSAHNYSAIVSTISGLLTLDLKSRLVPGQRYVCQFTLTTPRHPFVTVLQQCPAAEHDVIAQMHALCNHPDYIISSNAAALLRPVFLYLTCDPAVNPDPSVWQLINHHANSLLIDCLLGQQTHTAKLAARALSAYSTVLESALLTRKVDQVTALLPLLARGTTMIVTGHGRDPRPYYTLIERCMSEGVSSLYVGPLILTLLADNISESSLTHTAELLHVGLTITSKYEQTSLSLNIFAAFCLQWLHLPSYLTTNSLKFASKIIDLYLNENKEDTRLNTPNLKSNKMFETLIYTDSFIYLTVKLYQTWEAMRDNPEKLRRWFENIQTADSKLLLELVPFLIGILMEKTKGESFEEFSLKSLELLISLVDVKKNLAVQLLPILLFKLTNDKSPKIKMECLKLKALPFMAKTKENVPIIVSILNKLKANKSVPASFLIMLYTRLAETQVRCFPYLQELLVDPNISRPDDLKWETDIARATAVKRICQIRASTHGLELVSVISAILNKCTDKQSSIAASIALEALKELWEASAVAPIGAWKTLEPKLGRDNRPVVQVSICNLLSVIPSLRTQTPEYCNLLNSTAQRLWCYIADSNHPEVVYAACSSLGGYKIDDYTLKQVPEIYRKNVKLPASYCKTPADAARNPEDVLDYIPCEIWPKIYRYSSEWSLPGVQQLVRRAIEREVKGYRSGVYETREGATVGYLPPHSVVRGVLEGFRKQATHPTFDFPEPSLLSLLTTLTYEYPKPLPPLDLNFLHEIYHKGNVWKASCLKLAARQAQTSGSARRFVDNYLQGVVQNSEESDVDLVFDLLLILCRNMPPNSLRPVLEKCLIESYSVVANIMTKQPIDMEKIIKDLNKERDSKADLKYTEKEPKDQKNEDKDLKKNDSDAADPASEVGSKYKFVKQLDMIRESLESDKIHDANRILLSQFVENYFSVINDDNVSWPTYIKTCSSLPTDVLERITSPSSWWEVTSQSLRNACAVRAVRATYAGLVWLNEIIDACITRLTEQEFSLRCIYPALKVVDPDAPATKEWFKQLLARTQVAFKETDSDSSKQYLCSVFSVSVVVLSQYWRLQPDVTSHDLLPAAVAALLKRDAYRSCEKQVCEWLIHTASLCSGSLANSLRRAVLATKRDHLWMRLDRHFSQDTSLEE